jgi:methionyl-tRNA formyltransferase
VVGFQSVVILGVDQFAAFCANRINAFNYDAQVIDVNSIPNTMLFSSCKRLGVAYKYLQKADIVGYLLDTPKSLLIVSANNTWIIPDIILSTDGISAINLHHGLLPRHPGRNAEAWAIFEGDKKAGITWHFVTSSVDAGDIILQADTKLDESITSRKLLKIQNQLAKETFDNICEDVLHNRVEAKKQGASHNKIHYSWEIPNDGYLDPEWNSGKISRFLRAMDYGILKTLGDPKIIFKASGIHGYHMKSPKIILKKQAG